MNEFEFFQFKSFFGFGKKSQIISISLLYALTTLGCYFDFKARGTMYGYAPSTSLLFVPIYEELIFRGFLLNFFERNYGFLRSIIAVSILFGLWHLKNIYWLNGQALTQQMLYTALIFSPITCWITLKTRSLWPAVIIHYINNFPFEPWLAYLKGHQ